MTGDQQNGRRGRKPQHAAKAGPSELENGKTSLAPFVPQISGGGGIFKSAAVAVLRQERKLMTTGDITRVALERGLINCQGKTPEATMASALYTDVKRKHNKSVFTRPQEGLFGLREWLAEEFYPEGWSAPADSEGVAPYKRRGSGGSTATGKGRASTSRSGGRRKATGKGRKGSGAAASSGDSMDSEPSETEEMDHEVTLNAPVPMSDIEMDSQDVPAANNGSQDQLEAVEEEDDSMPIKQEDKQEADQLDEKSPAVRSSRPRRAAADTTYVNGVPMRRDSKDGRAATNKIRDLGDLPKDDLDLTSPLHVLGDAALIEQESEMDHAARRTAMDRCGSMRTPPDRLAALHEIAMSNSPRGMQTGSAKGSQDKRKRPRLQVQVGDDAQEAAPAHVTDLSYPGYPFASPMMNPYYQPHHPSFIHPPDMSPTGAEYMHPGNRMLGMQDAFPSARGEGPAGMWLSPTMPAYYHPGMTPRMPGMSMDGTARTDADRHMFSMSGAQQYPAASPYQPTPTSLAAGRGPHQGTPEERMADAEGLRLVVLRLEQKLGRANPITAKAWLALGRMFHSLAHSVGSSAAVKAGEVLRHASNCAAEAAAALNMTWQGVPHFDTLQRLVAALGPAAAEPTVLTLGPAAVLTSSGAQGLPALRVAESTNPPGQPGSADAVKATAATTLNLSNPTLNLGSSSPLPAATLQVIDAPLPAPNVPVLNLGAKLNENKPNMVTAKPLALQSPQQTMSQPATNTLDLQPPTQPTQPQQVVLGNSPVARMPTGPASQPTNQVQFSLPTQAQVQPGVLNLGNSSNGNQAGITLTLNPVGGNAAPPAVLNLQPMGQTSTFSLVQPHAQQAGGNDMITTQPASLNLQGTATDGNTGHASQSVQPGPPVLAHA